MAWLDRRRRVSGVAAAAFLIASLFSIGVARAALSNSVSPSTGLSVSTNSLAAPTSPSIARGTCVLLSSDALVVSWTATASTWADGYDVLRSTSGAGPFTVVGHVTGRTTTTFSDSSLSFSTTYYYRVRATKGAWTSSETSTVSMTTRTALCAI